MENDDRYFELTQFFEWFNTQFIQHQLGLVDDDTFEDLKKEYVAKCAEMKALKKSLGVETETEKRSE